MPEAIVREKETSTRSISHCIHSLSSIILPFFEPTNQSDTYTFTFHLSIKHSFKVNQPCNEKKKGFYSKNLDTHKIQNFLFKE